MQAGTQSEAFAAIPGHPQPQRIEGRLQIGKSARSLCGGAQADPGFAERARKVQRQIDRIVQQAPGEAAARGTKTVGAASRPVAGRKLLAAPLVRLDGLDACVQVKVAMLRKRPAEIAGNSEVVGIGQAETGA